MGPVVPVKLRPDQYSPLIRDLRKRKNAKVTRVKNVTKYKKVSKPRKRQLITSSTPPRCIPKDELLIEENDSNNNPSELFKGTLDRNISKGQVKTENITSAWRINSEKEAELPLSAEENGTLDEKSDGDEIENFKEDALGLVVSETDGEVEYSKPNINSSNHIDNVSNTRKKTLILKSSRKSKKFKFGYSKFEHKHGTRKLYCSYLMTKPNLRFKYGQLLSCKRVVAARMRYKGENLQDKGDLEFSSVHCNVNDEAEKNDQIVERKESIVEHLYEGSVTVSGDIEPAVNNTLMEQSPDNVHCNVEDSKEKILNEYNHERPSSVASFVMMDKHMLDNDHEESVLKAENLDTNQVKDCKEKIGVFDSSLKMSDNHHPPSENEDTTIFPCIVEWIWTALQARILHRPASTDMGNCEALETKNEASEDVHESNEHLSKEVIVSDSPEIIPIADVNNISPLCVAEWLLTARQIRSEQCLKYKDNDNKHEATTGLILGRYEIITESPSILSSLLTPSELQLQGFLANTEVSDLETHLQEWEDMDTSDPDVIITEVTNLQDSGNCVEKLENTKTNFNAEKESLKVESETIKRLENTNQPPKVKEEVDNRTSCINIALEMANESSDSDSDVVLLSDDETELYSSTIIQSSVHPWQEVILSQTWEEWPLPDKDIVQHLSQDTGLSVDNIMSWFEKRTEQEITRLWREI